MDAHDEFFSSWCEPEAWCERCEEHPAFHMVMQNEETPLEPFITYARVWDPNTQAYMVLCLRCNKEYGQTLQYVQAPPTHAASPKRQQRQYREHPVWPHLRRWGAGLLALCMAVWTYRKFVQNSTNTKPYSRTGP
jgi:hypothetical protein